ncbi:MAG TPA: tetratricopeptide repeat protein [Actinobacteria bacterium]|nr:cellulose synthase subunit BcsC [bacterium BMS3Bbin01]HDH26222.1 tetratricopeptide repeat protein [Actinomycetota bacterium]
MTAKRPPEAVPHGLLIVVVALTLVVLGLGAVTVALQLRPERAPATAAERDIAIWKARLDENPSAWAHTGLGLAYLDAGDETAATEAFHDALELNPNDWMALFQLGLLVKDTDPDTAVDYLSRSGDVAPRSQGVAPLVALGDLLLARGDAAGAKAAFERAISDYPFDFSSHFGLGQALEQLGDVAGALEQYQRAADFNPDSAEALDAIERLGGSPTTTEGP